MKAFLPFGILFIIIVNGINTPILSKVKNFYYILPYTSQVQVLGVVNKMTIYPKLP